MGRREKARKLQSKQLKKSKTFDKKTNLVDAEGVKGRKSVKKVETDGSSSSEEEQDMQANMTALAEQDPEFYQYLEQNDKDLLDMASTNPLDAISDADDDGKEEEKEEDQEKDAVSAIGSDTEQNGQEAQKIEITFQLVKSWRKKMREAPTLKLLRNVVTASKAAVNINKEVDIDEYKYSVSDERAFQELMFVSLKDLPLALQKMVSYKEKKGSRTVPSSSTASKVSSIVKSHASTLLTLVNDINNTETAALVLHSVDQLLPYLISYRRILKELVKSIVEVWATTRDLETQIASFAFLHNSCKEYKKAMLELVLKSTYSTFIKNCRQTNIRTMPLINFQKNSAAELFAIDEKLGYQTAFEYIRQLAITLRNTMTATTKKTHKASSKDVYKLVYNWQYCHSLDFWSRVLSFACHTGRKTAAGGNALSELIYPLVQVTIGTIRLNASAQYFPLRFYLIRSLLRVSQSTSTMIPIYPLLAEMLTSTAFTKKISKSKTNKLLAFDFDHNIKCTQAYIGTKVYQDGLSQQFVDLLGEFFVLHCKNIAFPELFAPISIMLRRYIKTSLNVKFSRQLSDLLRKLKQNAEFIEEQRLSADFTPKDHSKLASFLKDVAWDKTPLGSYVAIQREVKEEQVKLLRESLEEEDREKEAMASKQKQQEEEEEDVVSGSEMSDA